jgi:hypothetical protein
MWAGGGAEALSGPRLPPRVPAEPGLCPLSPSKPRAKDVSFPLTSQEVSVTAHELSLPHPRTPDPEMSTWDVSDARSAIWTNEGSVAGGPWALIDGYRMTPTQPVEHGHSRPPRRNGGARPPECLQ